MVKWSNLAFPKEFGGLGLTETRTLNAALLAKWIFKIESSDESLCVELLRRKYFNLGGVFQCSPNRVSQFWSGILNTRKWLNLGSEWLVGEGTHIFFWLDVWQGDCPLKVIFAELFRICNQREMLIAALKHLGIDGLTIRRSFGPTELDRWYQVKLIIENLTLSSSPDTLRWCLNSNKKYTTKSLYRTILFRGAIDERLQFV